MKVLERANKWIMSNDTGISSKTIWGVMMGSITNSKDTVNEFFCSIPADPSDFGRCYRLLLLIPEWKTDLQKVADIFPKWQPLIDNWEKCEQLYLRDLPTGVCGELYDFMKEIDIDYQEWKNRK